MATNSQNNDGVLFPPLPEELEGIVSTRSTEATDADLYPLILESQVWCNRRFATRCPI